MKRRLLSVLVFLALLLWGMRVATSFVKAEPTGDGLQIPARTGQAMNAGCPAPAPVEGRLENQLSVENLLYLNQLSLSPEGNQQCGVASVSMLLGQTGRLPGSQELLAETANRLWHSYARPTTMGSVTQMLNDQGLPATMDCLPANEAWQRIKAQINCQVPSIIASTRLTPSGSGHFIVVVGYREEGGRREIITYDSYGEWAGPGQGYRLNASYPESQRGAGVVYNFDEAWGFGSALCPGGYLLTVQP